ncbi:Di-copper centre-containing protein [Amniculicola lignicola CBS 123094]|uniref:tyrosinase n=1 Tax=Amniculicola lignicola CBS 123094 TaxID=1392246 RepID=A0A6A5WGP5_9PLEO|nr:Di-copper centre-containing protein [Amniculicola lignicola CBS 123094]
MWLLKFLVSVLLTTLAACTPVQSSSGGGRTRPFWKASKTLITGVEMVDRNSRHPWRPGHVHVRREVRDLKNNFPDMWNLYILGLRSLMVAEQAIPTSYYEIAAIHGRPFKAWEGAEQNGGNGFGYCPHNNAMFVAWHRPYLALFEELFKHVSHAAESFRTVELIKRFAVPADQFRLPYWDWAMQENNPVPDFFVSPTIEVIGFSGQPEIIPNPLYSYEFHPLVPGDLDGNFASWNHTVRWPISKEPNAVNQDNKIFKTWDQSIQSTRDNVGKGFVEEKDFNTFSKVNIEGPHGNIHYFVGGSEDTVAGHMWPVEISAFDPIFMLHHCNVDRLVALFQAVKPDIWITPEILGRGTYSIPDNSVFDADSPLPPFWRTESRFWTANDCRDTTTLGYAYPETTSWNFASPDLYKASVNASISKMYSMRSRKMLTGRKGTASGGALNHLMVNNRYEDWTINTRASPMTMPSTFMVRFYLIGDFSSDPVIDVGVWSVLMPANHDMPAPQLKSKRASTLEQTLKGSVSLTASLLDQITAGKLDSLDEREIVPYLTQKLTWKVFTRDGKLVPHDQLRGLVVEVVSASAYIPEDEDLLMEVSRDVKMHPEVTAGKGAGALA